MKCDEGYFQAKDGIKLFYRAWEQSQATPNVCILIHGYGDHSGRYNELIGSLSELPFSFYAFDLRGQGRSGGRRVFVDYFHQYAADCNDFLQFLGNQGKIRSKKLFLFGHSLGGLIAIQVASQDQGEWSGLILSSPCFQLYGVSWSLILRFFVKILARLAPHLVMRNLVKPRYLFHDSKRMEEYLKDSQIERRVAVHLANEIVKACQCAQKERIRLQAPLLVLASGDDRIVSLPATQNWFDKVQAVSKKMVTYPNLYHEIFNETDPKPVQDLKEFLAAESKGDHNED
ncbi:MAG: lysophospholipase [Candidatus Omnitrophica bacterium]|nr:lysophospholipase [Candidatus Omnitrophota bacterium]